MEIDQSPPCVTAWNRKGLLVISEIDGILRVLLNSIDMVFNP